MERMAVHNPTVTVGSVAINGDGNYPLVTMGAVSKLPVGPLITNSIA